MVFQKKVKDLHCSNDGLSGDKYSGPSMGDSDVGCKNILVQLASEEGMLSTSVLFIINYYMPVEDASSV